MKNLKKYAWVVLPITLIQLSVLMFGNKYWLLNFAFSSGPDFFQKYYPRFWWLVFVFAKGHIVLLLFLSAGYIYQFTIPRIRLTCAKYKAAVVSKTFFYEGVKVLGTVLLSTIFTLMVCEVILRHFFSVTPGSRGNDRYFSAVTKLKSYKVYMADSMGIMKVDAAVTQKVSERIQLGLNNKEWKPLYSDYESDPGHLVSDVEQFNEFNFSCLLKSYIKNPTALRGDLDSAILEYITHPINSEGFRSIHFKPYRSAKKRILLLGDSFTWGHSATNFFLSYADNLLAKGYAVYNTGITCTDPVQYEQVAKKFVPVLKPDVVVMNVYLGNDIQYYIRHPKPFVVQMYTTNAGLLQNDFEGTMLLSADSVYQIIHNAVYFKNESSVFAKLCSYSSLGTLLYRSLHNEEPYPKIPGDVPTRLNYPYVNENATEVMKLCERFNARLIVSIIPYVDESGTLRSTENFPNLLNGIPYYLSPVEKSGYVSEPDGHFNNKGHKEYADFLQKLIENKN